MSDAQNHTAAMARCERAFVGSLLQGDARALDSDLRAGDFTDPLCARIFGAALSLEELGKTCDLVTLADTFPDVDASFLVELAQEAASGASLAGQHAQNIREAAQRRVVRDAALSLARDAADLEKPLSELLDSARARLDTLAGALPSGNSISGEDALCALWEELTRGPVEPVTRFGFSRIDDALTIAGGKLIVIGARPSVGKSTLLLQLALNAIRGGKRVFLFSSEMKNNEVTGRMVSRASGVNSDEIAKRTVTELDLQKIVESFSLVPGAYFRADDVSKTPQEIRREALRMRANGGLDLIVVDYLQILEPGRKTGNRTEAIGVISRELKRLAMELSVPVLTASQLNRRSEQNDAPRLSDLRESGSIEQDADAVLLIHAPKDLKDPERQLILAKNRQGRCGGIDLLFDGSRMMFCEPVKGGDKA